MNIQLVVFDMAGTVVDEQNTVYKTLHQAIEAAGFACDYQEVLDMGAGKAKLQAIIDILSLKFGEVTAAQHAEKIHETFLNQLEDSYRNNEIVGQPNAEEVFKKLRSENIKIALNTGYSRNIANILLDKLGWVEQNLIDYSVTFDEVENGRPAPDMIVKIMEHFKIADASTVVKIGDAIIDIQEGQNASCGMVFGITTGAHTREQLTTAIPTAVLDNLIELQKWI